MAAKSNNDTVFTIKSFKKHVRLASLNKKPFESSELCVLAIHRYLSDPKHASQSGSRHWEAVDVLQLTLADCTHKIKVILSPDLNKLVQTNQLKISDVIVITRCRLHYDEQDLSGGSVVIVQELRTVGHKLVQNMTDFAHIAWCDDCSQAEQMDVPVTSSRGYFVNVWSSMEMYGQIWKTAAPVASSLGETTPRDIYSIKDLRRWGTVRSASPAVLVRVLCKSRMIHYAKPSKDDKWPFQVHMLVADNSGACTAVFWNAMCPNFYHSIREGCVLLLKGFTVKKSFQMMPRFKPALKDRELFDIDINLNSHHPASGVKIIQEDGLPDSIQLPSVSYTFVTRRQLGGLPDNFICDVVGVVSYVGRFEREPILNKFGHDSGGFWLRRWVHLVDGTCNKPFCVHIYRMAEGLEGLQMYPGQVLLCSHLRVVSRPDQTQSSRSARHVYLTTTAQSQVCVVDEEVYHRLGHHAALTRLWDWKSTSPCDTWVSRAVVGGYFTYPSLPSDIDAIRHTLKDSTVLASEDWRPVLSSLSYREGRQVLVQAMMVSARFSGDHERQNAGSTSKEAPAVPSEVLLEPEIYDTAESLVSVGSSHIDEDLTLPMKYRHSQRGTIQQRLQFPDVELSHDTHSPAGADVIERVDVPYFAITWHGLNSQVLLHSLCICPQNVKKKTKFIDMIAGVNVTDNHVVSDKYSITAENMEAVLSTVWQCANKRFLLVLDCYQGEDNLEVILNRALPLAT